jgi:hypothetical protein
MKTLGTQLLAAVNAAEAIPLTVTGASWRKTIWFT